MVDTKEFELPETVYVRDIENRVFQGIVAQSLAKIPGIAPIEGSFINNILGRPDGANGIYTEQDPDAHSITIKAEVNVAYGISIPQKADEIQTKITEDITRMTGLHVAQVHVVFKGLIIADNAKKDVIKSCPKPTEYSEIF